MHSPQEKNPIASVLLVDDEADFLELLSQRLTNRGMEVITASNGVKALEEIKNRDFDIIVLDLSMPGMDGIETMKRIKTKSPQTETIMLTGHATLKSGIEAMKSGAGDFLEKPANIDLLIQKIHDAQYRKIQELEKHSQDNVKKILKKRGW